MSAVLKMSVPSHTVRDRHYNLEAVLGDLSIPTPPDVEVTCNCAGFTNYKKCKHSTAYRMQLELTKKAYNMLSLYAELKGHSGNLTKELAIELTKEIHAISLPNIQNLINQYRSLIIYSLMHRVSEVK